MNASSARTFASASADVKKLDVGLDFLLTDIGHGACRRSAWLFIRSVRRTESSPPRPRQVPFQAHIELLRFFLAHRDEIVERIQGMGNAQREPSANLYSRTGWSNVIERSWLRWDAHRNKTTYRMNRR
jgi:hypothetical protein